MITEEAANSGKDIPSMVDESPGIHAHYTWTAEELLTAQRLHGLHTLRRPFRYAIGVVLVFVFLSGCVGLYRGVPLFPVFVMILIPLYIAFFRPYYRKWATKRQFRKRPDESSRLDWIFTQERVKLASSDGAKGEMPWSTYVKAVISPQGVLLYPMAAIFYWLPQHAFESEEAFQEFISLVRKGVPKTHEAGP